VTAKTARVKTAKTASAMNKKRLSFGNLIAGYLLAAVFIALMLFNQKDKPLQEVDHALVKAEENKTIETQEPIVYNPPSVFRTQESVYIDRLQGRIIRDDIDRNITVLDNTYHIDADRRIETTVIENERFFEHDGSFAHGSDVDIGIHRGRLDNDVDHEYSIGNRVDKNVDHGLLDRRLAELDKETGLFEEFVEKDRLNRHDKIGIDKNDGGIDMSKMTLARDDDAELGEIDLDFDKNNGKGYGVGKGGELYAYNYPSRGVGAGIGSSAIGAGAGGGAGLGAAIGEGMLNGESVPTLGGVGTGALPLEGQPSDAPPSGGVGGLVGGAGAGGAAGLTQGYITEKLGMGVGPAKGVGYGGNGAGRGYNYDHLPKDGALHIMMHVDGSGSILNTRKQLDIMKETILKDALLPYYNNDENLYNNRVTIVSSSGERTLKFFAEAAKKDNVLAIAFQDEAQPAYHLPNFNKKPEDHYIDDIGKLKSSLNGYNGVYRGVMFQVDRGKTFAKSFKEFVGNAFQGKGYLESNNLKKYYRDNNNNHIKNKDGIVFSDEYHAKDSGDPKYYLDLIFEASRRIGLDLDIYGGGLKDGKYNDR
jgi:putative NIF3 family GTP cyclohydrolase 1 type 2